MWHHRQHWTGPVLQEFSMLPLGAAETTTAMVAATKKKSLENIFSKRMYEKSWTISLRLVSEGGKWLELMGEKDQLWGPFYTFLSGPCALPSSPLASNGLRDEGFSARSTLGSMIGDNMSISQYMSVTRRLRHLAEHRREIRINLSRISVL